LKSALVCRGSCYYSWMGWAADRHLITQAQRRMAQREPTPWRQHVDFLKKLTWPERVVIVLFEITAVSLAAIGGMIFGVIIRFLID
jgi:hypothetical protein